ncbi:transposase [Aequitasia blattaphilus]|uniref:IS1634 family transposase n=1 Tax=Aequitasia blattaphilus TaxID=2949332 RepID=A0ABT1EB48_9FIRM|nr:IS1634 family transposase [Aequitasia blattaphilus]MCP1102849.1 IS1634 family transposase [Aequitasia blattaphilus]MCR8615489.1 IS1634 family transposase [Aequitasia blattaphilus]
MRLGYSRSKYSISYYAQKTIYVDGKNKSLIVTRFGSEKYICETYGVKDAKAWAQHQVDLMNQAEKEESGEILIDLSPSKDLALNQQRLYNGGYLFLQDVYYSLGLDKICRAISKKHNFEFNLNSIFSRLIYTRILYPSSKQGTYRDSAKFIEQPDFDLHQVYRALSVIAEESDYIQSTLYKNTLKLSPRKTGIIYYDCTNFYFETEQAEDDKQYGLSKEGRALPIVGMGLFMDAEGIPLSFSIYPGNHNEQPTMIPLEEKLLTDFGMSKFVVCTDAGLSSLSNRKFNDYSGEDGSRSFVTTQSIKKLKGFLKEWALDSKGWYLSGQGVHITYNISELDEVNDKDKVFYKSRWIKENGLEQQLIVSYSIKYKNYQRKIRNNQIERALKAIEKGASGIDHKRPTDCKRFIKVDRATKNGEIADQSTYYLDKEAIRNEELYDGFYAVCTNLEEKAGAVVKINQRRWEIEECFRIMKSEFEARPVYLQRKERITAHFITCFIALIVYRYTEKRLGESFTCKRIIECLKDMDFVKHEGKGYEPVYTRTELTDELHKEFGFTTSKEIIPIMKMKNICAQTKK